MFADSSEVPLLPPNDTAFLRNYVHIGNTDMESVSQLDTAANDRFVDMDPSDLQVSSLGVGFAPWGMAYERVADGSGGTRDGALLVVGETASGTGGLVRYDPATLSQTASLALPGPARAVGLMDDEHAYVAYEIPSSFDWVLALVDLQPQVTSSVFHQDTGHPIDLQVMEDAATGAPYAYIVTHDFGCTGTGSSMASGPGICPIFEDCEGGPPGGGGDANRTLRLQVLDVTPTEPLPVQVADLVLSNTGVSCAEPLLLEAGLDFNAAGTRVYIADPHQDCVHVVETQTFSVVDCVPVGSHPTDVEIVEVAGVDTVFVTNRDDDSISFFAEVPFPAVTTVVLDPADVENLQPSALAAISDGLRLYVAAPGESRIVVVSGQDPIRLKDFSSVGSARRVAIQRSGG